MESAAAAASMAGEPPVIKVHMEQLALLSETFLQKKESGTLLWIPRRWDDDESVQDFYRDIIKEGIHQPVKFPRIIYVDGVGTQTIPYGILMEDNFRYGCLADIVTRHVANLPYASDARGKTQSLANGLIEALTALLQRTACHGRLYLDLQPHNLVLQRFQPQTFVAYLRIPTPHLLHKETDHKYDAPPLAYVYMLCALYLHLFLAANTPGASKDHQDLYSAMLVRLSRSLAMAMSFAGNEYPLCVEGLRQVIRQLETQTHVWNPDFVWPLSLSGFLGTFCQECSKTLMLHVNTSMERSRAPALTPPLESMRQIFESLHLSSSFTADLGPEPDVKTTKRQLLRKLFLCSTRRLGAGTFNTVYAKDRDTVLRVPVSEVAGVPQNNRKEIDVMQRLALSRYQLHPTIRIPEWQDLESNTLIVEMQRGTDLHLWLRSPQASVAKLKLVIDNAVELMHTLSCRGLFCADIKPANVLVLNDDNLHVRIIDVDPRFMILLDPETNEHVNTQVQTTRRDTKDEKTELLVCNLLRQWKYVCMLCLFFLHVHWQRLELEGKATATADLSQNEAVFVQTLQEVEQIIGKNLQVALTPLVLHTRDIYNSVWAMFWHLKTKWTTLVAGFQGQKNELREDVKKHLITLRGGTLWETRMFHVFLRQVLHYAWSKEARVLGLKLFHDIETLFLHGTRSPSDFSETAFECTPHMVMCPQEGTGNVGSCLSELEQPPGDEFKRYANEKGPSR